MASPPLKTFIHPQKAYELKYPAHWEKVEQDEGRSCGFGPYDRDDVGLWISIMPMSIDTDRLIADLPRLMEQGLPESNAGPTRIDTTLKHHALKADILKEGEAGHYWIVAGGDLVLFASSQVPAAERDLWNPAFDAVMASLEITREDELLVRKVANEVLEQLRERYPEQDFHADEKGIRGKDRMVYLGNVSREVKSAPHRRAHIIKHFVEGLSQSVDAPLGQEQWDEVIGCIVPLLKPREYIVSGTPTQHLLTNEWLVDVLICYAIKDRKYFRFVTGWDVDRWGITAEILHQQSLENLTKLPWPKRLEGARQHDGGRLIMVDTRDSLAASRLLHPELHRLFSGPLGSPFWAGIPNRDTLVAFSNRRQLKKRMARLLKKDHDSSAYPITHRPLLVTADGIALGEE